MLSMRRIGRLSLYLVIFGAGALLLASSGAAKSKPKPKPKAIPVKHVTLYAYPISGGLREFGVVGVDCVPPSLATPSSSNLVILTGGESVRLTTARTFLKYIVVVTCVDNTPPPPSPVTLNFSGNGTLQLAPFTLPVAEQFCWTSSWPDGGDIGDPNGDFSAYDNGGSSFDVSAYNEPSGCSYIAAGTYQLTVDDEGGWTISIHQ